MPDNIATLLELGRHKLDGRSEHARLDAELLLGIALKVGRNHLFGWPEQEVAAGPRAEFMAMLERRAGGEPLAYISGEKEFWSLPLTVTTATLIPRPETELLVELALAHAAPDARLADLGTGSGAIAIALASELPAARVVASDISAPALQVAKANALRHGIENIEFRPAASDDWFGVLAGEQFDLLVSNPPYVRADDRALREGAIRFEPRDALAAGRDGLQALRQIIPGAVKFLTSGACLLVEHGESQGAAVRQLFKDAGFVAVATHRDLAGHERVTQGQFFPPSA